MHTVIFSHGKESGPQGTKINRLSRVAQQLGFATHSVDYRNCIDVNERVKLLLSTIQHTPCQKLILVGSSMGGYLATVAANTVWVDGLFFALSCLVHACLSCTELPTKMYTHHFDTWLE